MAKTASNSDSTSGKGKPVAKGKPAGRGKPAGKPAQGKKAVAKRADAKPARGKTQQKGKSSARSARPAEKKGLIKFLRDVRIEMGKVTWPTRKDLAQSTLVVLVAVAIAAAYTFALDEVFSQIIDRVVSLLT